MGNWDHRCWCCGRWAALDVDDDFQNHLLDIANEAECALDRGQRARALRLAEPLGAALALCAVAPGPLPEKYANDLVYAEGVLRELTKARLAAGRKEVAR